MDKGANLQNPYANVTIPRAQLKSSFIRDTLGEDLDGVVIANPSAVPTYPPYTVQEGFSNNNIQNPVPPNGYRIHTQESWRRPYNPYAGDKPQNGGPNNAMYPIDLDKQYKDTSAKGKTGCCCKCCPCCCPCCCCCKPCCVIS
ncbi:hypothetical protein GDO78_017956 [Eleutherodactylus coqui]|uniref:Uncharacterized protein n=1 Tax=Eleutherodactylus coqui TaxID=57060 RepID=A0A8J6BQJ8_ELECQ|nr:hypothetical protein GDO78_017956 [Eleutherodactylus coqui]